MGIIEHKTVVFHLGFVHFLEEPRDLLFLFFKGQIPQLKIGIGFGGETETAGFKIGFFIQIRHILTAYQHAQAFFMFDAAFGNALPPDGFIKAAFFKAVIHAVAMNEHIAGSIYGAPRILRGDILHKRFAVYITFAEHEAVFENIFQPIPFGFDAAFPFPIPKDAADMLLSKIRIVNDFRIHLTLLLHGHERPRGSHEPCNV